MTRKILLLLFYTAISSIYSCFFLQSAEAISATHQSREQNDCALPKLPECCPIRQGPVIIEEGKLKTKLLFCPTSCEGTHLINYRCCTRMILNVGSQASWPACH